MASSVPVSQIPLSLLFGAPRISLVRMSPDGRWVTWLAPWQGAQNLWRISVEELGTIEQAVRLTQEVGRGVEAYRWSADGQYLIFDRDARGDESWQLCALELASGDVIELTPAGGINARYYASSTARPGWIAAGLNERDPSWHDVFWIELASGRRELAFQNEQQLFSFVFDRQLVPRMAMHAAIHGRTIVRLEEGKAVKWREVAAEDELVTQLCGVDEEEGRVWWVGAEGRDKAVLISSPLDPESEPDPDSDPDPDSATAAAAAVRAPDRLIAWDPDADIVEVVMLPEGRGPLAVFSERDRPRLRGVGEHAAAISSLCGDLGAAFDILTITTDGARYLVALRRPDQPLTYFLLEPKSPSRPRIGELVARPELGACSLAPMNARTVPSRDGLPLVAYLTEPLAARPAAGWPTVLWVHGGPWRRDSYEFDPRHQWLASRGYAVLSVNFRGSTGLGKRFVNAGDREWAGKMHDDLLDVVDAYVADGVIDPVRVAIAGGSFGGYAALVGLTFTPERFACGVSICGPSNLVTSQAQKPAYWAAVAELRARRIGDPRTEEGRAFLADRSPLNRADRICRPLLVAHGASDPRVRRVESDQLVAAAEKNGAAVTYLVYPDEGHGLVRAPNRLSFYAAMEAFLAAHLGAPTIAAPSLDGAFDGTDVELAAGAEHLPGLRQAWAARRR